MVRCSYLALFLALCGCTNAGSYGEGSHMPACLFRCTSIEDNTQVGQGKRDLSLRKQYDLGNSDNNRNWLP